MGLEILRTDCVRREEAERLVTAECMPGSLAPSRIWIFLIIAPAGNGQQLRLKPRVAFPIAEARRSPSRAGTSAMFSQHLHGGLLPRQRISNYPSGLISEKKHHRHSHLAPFPHQDPWFQNGLLCHSAEMTAYCPFTDIELTRNGIHEIIINDISKSILPHVVVNRLPDLDCF